MMFEASVNGEPISLMVTRKKDIMIEASDDGYISRDDIDAAAHAKGFNCCFNTSSKRAFAESCHFNNILITKREINDESNNEVVCEFYLSELRKSPAKLRRFLEE